MTASSNGASALWRAFPGIVLSLAVLRVALWYFDNGPAFRELVEQHRIEPQQVRAGDWMKAVRHVVRIDDCPVTITALVLDQNRQVIHTLDFSQSWNVTPQNGRSTPFTRMYAVPPYPPGRYWLRTVVVCARNPLNPAVPQILQELPFEMVQ